MKVARACVALVAVLWLAAHTAEADEAKAAPTVSKQDVVGKWVEVEGGELVEFSEDGTFTTQSSDSKFVGTYKFRDDGRMQMDVGGPLGKGIGPIVRKVSLDKDELTLTDAQGKTTKYHRPK